MRLMFYRILGGITMIMVGLLIWLNNLGVLHIYWRRDWPVLLIAIGVIEVMKHIIKRT